MQKYIDLGWNTVPLKGKLERLEGGAKTLPIFEKNWRDKYEKVTNNNATAIGGAITGRCSGIIAIDCDNTNTWDIFRALDVDNKMVFLSKGKGYKAGTLIYAYDDDLPSSFSIQDNNFALDFYSNRGFIYLATAGNKTKVPLAEVSQPPSLPPAVKALLLQLSIKQKPAESAVSNVFTASCLNPLVTELLKRNKYMPGLFKIITPKDFRSVAQYVAKGHLHPNDVPAGRGSEYMSKVSAILGSDISIDETMYMEAMVTINEMFSKPMQSGRLEKTILDPMLTRHASIDGVPIWKYEDNWDAHRLIIQSKRQAALDIGFDDHRNMYYVVDEINQEFKSFARDSELMAFIEAVAVAHPSKKEVKCSVPMLNVKSDPSETFGFHEGADPTARDLNTFIQTPELAILRDPEIYEAKYTKPLLTIKYMETLIPDPVMRNYVTSFIKTKLTTFKYSPVILYFIGKHGSGKDLFVSLLEKMMGSMGRPTVKEFLEVYNGYMLDSYFVQLDEYGNQLTNQRDKDEALGKIKAYTGKPKIRVREMRTDGFDYYHHVTFIMTANKNPLMIEDGDRRVTLINTPNVLADAMWIEAAGGMSDVHDRIMEESKDWAYYLATEVPALNMTDYMRAYESEDKLKLIADSLYAAGRIAFCIKHCMFDYLVDMCDDYECPDVGRAFSNRHVTLDDLFILYAEMTDHNGEQRSLTKVIKTHGIQIRPTSKDGVKSYNITLPEENPFEADE